MIPQEHRSKIPDRIQKRLADLQSEIDEIVATARCKFLTEAPQRIGFTFSGSAKTGDLMSEYERAQSVAFVTRYDNLPEDMKTHLVEHEGRWMISNLWVLRHVLNDFRPLIHNQHDAVHYNHVHRTWFKMLQRADYKDGIMIRVRDENERDITTVYSQSLVENKQAISAVVNRLDFGYLYNGVLQHSDPSNRRFDRGNCDSGRRHIFNLTAMAQTPEFADHALRLAASGWRISGIYKQSSGAFLTVTTGFDPALNGIANQRPNQVLENPYSDTSGRPLTIYLNPLAFSLPPIGALGNMRRASIQGPGTWQFDAALSKIFRILGTQSAEFRAEAYNVTNSFRPGNPSTILNTPAFGQIRTSLDSRIMQFALKYIF